MSERQRRLSERVTHPAYLEGLTDKSIAELRAMREECREAENEVSFERRLCQARLDILAAEINRREGRSEDDLVARLPEILGGERRQAADLPLPSRAPDFSVPRNADVPRRRVEEVVGEQTLARLSDIDVAELHQIMDTLADYEKTVSARRRAIQDVMDKVQGEIVRRYTSGEADPTAALS